MTIWGAIWDAAPAAALVGWGVIAVASARAIATVVREERAMGRVRLPRGRGRGGAAPERAITLQRSGTPAWGGGWTPARVPAERAVVAGVGGSAARRPRGARGG